MDLIHTSKFEERNQVSSTQQSELINDLQKLYPFAVPDVIATENNPHVLYHKTAIATLLQKGICKKDAIMAKKKERKQMLACSCSIKIYDETEQERKTFVFAS